MISLVERKTFMKTYVGNGYGRHVVIHLGKGEQVLESIQKEVKRLNIQSGIVTSGIGSARKIVYHRIGNLENDPLNIFETMEGPTEIGAIQGLIIDGEPHLHITCYGEDGAYAGHLEPGCEVQYLAEISIIELDDADLVRRADEFGISYIDKRSNV